MKAILILRIEDGKIGESWDVADEMGFLQQLGLIGDEDAS